MGQAKESLLHELEFEGGSKVVLRNPTADDMDQAATSASLKSENPMLFSMAMSKEITKLLIVSVNGKQLNGAEKESLGSLLELDEMASLTEEVGKMLGKRKVVRRVTTKGIGGK